MDAVKDLFKEYIAMFVNYTNFNDRTTVRGYWMAFLFNFVIGGVLGLIFSKFLTVIPYLYSLAVLVPGLAIAVRRLRDAGYPWTNLFWAFLPIAGVVILIIRLIKPSLPDDGTPVV